MASNVSKKQIASARHADLYAFLMKYHSSNFKTEGDSIRPKDNHSISIKKGYHGYKDFSTEETGNSIEFLTNHMGYTFVEAVQALSDVSALAQQPTDVQQDGIENVPPKFPEPVNGMYKNLFAFLKNRSISTETIQKLVKQKLLYQEKSKNNIVFINMERDFAELRGTYTFGNPFHGIVPHSRHDGFWWFTSRNAAKAYICEAAIDAISLYELHKIQGNHEEAYYISIAGVAKQPAIDRLKKYKYKLVLSVDNDDAGQNCRNRNSDLEYIIPVHKDWNEDLQSLKNNNVAVG